jgi:acetyl coenzyme A synthetase (ADP forming)-like protein
MSAPARVTTLVPYGAHPLDVFFKPSNVALIGASEEPGSVGRAILWNLISSPFGGTVFPVNPKRSNVLGIKSYKAVTDVPSDLDLAVIATPAATVAGVLRQCAEKGVRGAIVISAGFREIGNAGAALEAQVLEAAREGGIRLLGPNSLGLMSPASGLNASFASGMARPGNVAFVSQSGALATAVLDWGERELVGFSSFVSIGSGVDVDWGELIQYLGADPRTRSILLYMESVGNARSFLSAAREVALTKPILVYKAGKTAEGARAATRHLGVDAGSDEVLDAAFERTGVLRVERLSDLFYMAELLGKQPRPRGPRLAILSNAGGPAILATDALVSQGGKLAELSPETLSALDGLLPEHWSHANPVDLLADASPECFAKAVEIVSKDPNVDGLLAVLAPQAPTDPTKTAEALKPFAKLPGKPIVASWMGGSEVAAGDSILLKSGIPTFPYADTAARAFLYLWTYGEHLRRLYETPESMGQGIAPDAREKSLPALETLRRERRAPSESDLRELLARYGIAFGTPANAAPLELRLRSFLDPQFGPVIEFGQGGALGRAFADSALGLPPLNMTLARRLTEHTRVNSAMERLGHDMAPVESALVRFSLLVAELPSIAELVIDPLYLDGETVRAGAAKLTLHAPEAAIEKLPKPSIRPYPSQYVDRWTTKAGLEVTVRPIRPEDEPLVAKFHETLSERTVYLRYLQLMRLTQRVAHDRLIRICFNDYDREIALVTVRDEGTPDAQIVGISRLQKLPGTEEAEFAIVISDDFQGHGLGPEMLRRLVQIGRDENLTAIRAEILSENSVMQRIAAKQGFQLIRELGDPSVTALLVLRS